MMNAKTVQAHVISHHRVEKNQLIAPAARVNGRKMILRSDDVSYSSATGCEYSTFSGC